VNVPSACSFSLKAVSVSLSIGIVAVAVLIMASLLLLSEVKIAATKSFFVAGCFLLCCHVVARALPLLHAVLQIYPTNPFHIEVRQYG
jgi:hypothetical protein